MDNSKHDWLDKDHLQSLIDAGGGDPEFLQSLLEDFEETFKEDIALLLRAIEADDCDHTVSQLHSLKGTCSTVGMLRLSKRIEEHEISLRSSGKPPSAADVTQIQALAQETLQQMSIAGYLP